MRNSNEEFTPFSEIIGQERAIGFLKRVIDRGRMPHAYLFVGIPGIGKMTTAVALTQAINCFEPVRGEGCSQCRSCRQIMSGNFPDIILIEPDGQNIRIEQIRDLNRAISFKPVSGLCRVSIIRQAETMTEEAANALLKTLEEPPRNNILIVNVTEPLALLPTIVSRCQKVLFRPLSAQAIMDWLREKKGLDNETASVLAKLSEGSLGRANRMSEGDFLERRQDYLFRLIRLPGLSPVEALEMAVEFARHEKSRAADTSEKEGVGLFDLLSTWKSWFRDLVMVTTGCPGELLINTDFSHKLKKMRKGAKITNLINSFFIIEQAQRDLQRTRNVDLMMENTVLILRRLNGEKN